MHLLQTSLREGPRLQVLRPLESLAFLLQALQLDLDDQAVALLFQSADLALLSVLWTGLTCQHQRLLRWQVGRPAGALTDHLSLIHI